MKKKSSSKKRAFKPVKPSDVRDKALRDHLLYLLKGGGAHATFEAAIGDWPVQLGGAKVANFPHTAWMLLEHMRLAPVGHPGVQPQLDACVSSMARRILACVGSARKREGMDGEYGCVQEGPADDERVAR